MGGTGRVLALNNKIQFINHLKPIRYRSTVKVISFQHFTSFHQIISDNQNILHYYKKSLKAKTSLKHSETILSH